MTFFDNLLKSFVENLKQLTKMNDFLLFLRFHENCRILSCFHHKYEFCMQKYPSKCIFIEFLYKAKFWLILWKAIALRFSRFSQKFENFWFCFICLLFHLKIIFYDFLWQSAQEFQWKFQTINKKWMIFYHFCVFMKTVGFCTVFIADMNSACKNTLVSVYLLNFHRKHNFG